MNEKFNTLCGVKVTITSLFHNAEKSACRVGTEVEFSTLPSNLGDFFFEKFTI